MGIGVIIYYYLNLYIPNEHNISKSFGIKNTFFEKPVFEEKNRVQQHHKPTNKLKRILTPQQASVGDSVLCGEFATKTVKIILDLPKILWGIHTLSEHIIVLKKMSSGIAVGLKKGFPVEKREKIVRPSNKKAVSLSNNILIIYSRRK